MGKLIYIALLLPILSFGQSKINPSRSKGEVFKHRPDTPTEDLNKSGLIVVTRTPHLVFEDNTIPDEYKKMTEKFFNTVFRNEYKKLNVKYHLKVEKRAFGDIYIEGIKVGSSPNPSQGGEIRIGN
ncbi:hypothetical protein [Capnocytophaga canis]|uniref:hypothetical protein n=1 Tax=Capnocytophaga canis TaxID=1848903 RepID=UPI0037CE979F